MADPSKELTKSTLTKPEKKGIQLIADGHKRVDVARKLAKGDKKKAKYWRRRLAQLMREEQGLQEVGLITQANMIEGLIPASEALSKRAGRGRVDAIKLLFEATGFHNPKIQHEHSGDISITLKGIPRPPAVETTDSVDSDAEVVE